MSQQNIQFCKVRKINRIFNKITVANFFMIQAGKKVKI